jgi:hypothetical protein
MFGSVLERPWKMLNKQRKLQPHPVGIEACQKQSEEQYTFHFLEINEYDSNDLTRSLTVSRNQ